MASRLFTAQQRTQPEPEPEVDPVEVTASTSLFSVTRRHTPRRAPRVEAPSLLVAPPATTSPPGADVPEVVSGQVIDSAWGSAVADDLSELWSTVGGLPANLDEVWVGPSPPYRPAVRPVVRLRRRGRLRDGATGADRANRPAGCDRPTGGNRCRVDGARPAGSDGAARGDGAGWSDRS